MSGHSKWKTIQHKKGTADAKRGKIFSKMSKELTVVAKAGGGDPTMNAALRTLIDKAKSYNMPADNITRAIKKGTGELGSTTYEEITYEGYAAGGVGIVVTALTDNRNRAASEIRHIFTQQGSSFAAQGSVSRNFQRKGQILVDCKVVAEDKLMDIVLNAGADDMQVDGDQYEILTDPSAFSGVVDALAKANIPTLSAEVGLIPTLYAPVADKTVAQSVMRFVAALEDNDDVQNVYTNMDLDDSVAALLEGEG